MKVLLVSPLPPPVGGIATVTANLIGYLQTNPGNLEILLCNTTLKFRSITSQSTILRIFSGLYNSINTYFFVRKIVKNEPPEVIHLASSASFALFKDLLIILLADRYKIPIILHWHFGRIPELSVQNNWEWKLLKHVIKKSARSIVIDSRSYITLRKAGLNNALNIPNPLGLEVEKKINFNFGKVNQKLSNRIVFVGHIVRSKGVYELVDACLKLSSIKDLSLIGPCEENVKNDLIVLAGIRENGSWLNLTGELNNDQVLEQMYISPILALPSYTEGFPNAVLEGMAMGCAVIATDVGAIPEMLDVDSDKPCGICVPPHNSRLLSTAINKLIQDPVKTRMMGENGIRRVLNNYTIKKIAEEYSNLWKLLSNLNPIYVPEIKKGLSQIASLQFPGEGHYNQKKINVLLISPLPPPVGGIASWTPQIVSFFKITKSDIKITLLNSALKGKSITSNSLIKRYYSGIANFLWINIEFNKLIKNSKPDVIHLISSSSLALYKDYFLNRTARRSKIPVIIHWRFGRIPSLAIQNNWEWNLLKKVIKRSTLSILIDTRSFKTLRIAGFKNIVNIPNPMGLDVEHKSRTLLVKSTPRPQGHLIFVGHIVKNKGVFELVEACLKIPDIKDLSLIGPCEEDVKKKLQALALKRENGSWLNLAGELSKDKVLEHMSNTLVLVLPSYTEGFPNAVLEGMAMGCAVIATDVGAIPEMLDIQSSKPCGICVPPFSVEKLMEAILELLKNHSKAEEMGKNGIQRVLSNYTMQRITKQYISVWNNITEQNLPEKYLAE